MTGREVRRFGEIIKNAKNILLTTHLNPDGDGIGTGLALMRKFIKMGKKVDFINRDKMPSIYEFLPNSSKIKNMKNISGVWDAVILLECPDFGRNGNIIDYKKQAKTLINIDHHPDNDMYGDLRIVDSKAAAVGLQVYEIMKRLKWEIDKDIASCIYTAIITDTGSFRYSNTTPEVHMVAAELLRAGADPEYIAFEVYATTKASTALLMKMLTSLKIQGKIGWSRLTQRMFRDTGAAESDTDNFINSIRSIKEVEIAILFKETARDRVKASLRSRNGHDVNKIAQKFGGGGHKHAAGCVIKSPIDTAEKLLLAEVRRQIK